MILFVLKSFTKPPEKLKCRNVDFFFLIFAIYLKYWVTRLVSLVTLKIHDSSKDFNSIIVVTIKSIL